MYSSIHYDKKAHRLIPSKFPPSSLFDWVSSEEELEQLADLEGLTNERIQAELGSLPLIPKEEWVGGTGSTPIMAAFTHLGYPSRFSDGSYGVYYAASSLETAIKETIFHRERFYKASKEKACSIIMREYVNKIKKPMIDLRGSNYQHLFHRDPAFYSESQKFGKTIQTEQHWGLFYSSLRHEQGFCMALFKPSALSIPCQGAHLRYIWNGEAVSEVYIESQIFIDKIK